MQYWEICLKDCFYYIPISSKQLHEHITFPNISSNPDPVCSNTVLSY